MKFKCNRQTTYGALRVCAILLLMAANSWGKSYRFDYEKVFPVGDRLTLEIKSGPGNIKITAGGDSLTVMTVKAVKTVRAADDAEASRVAEAVRLQISSKENEARIETSVGAIESASRSFWEKLLGQSEDWFVSVDYEIVTPTNCRLTIGAGQGEITIEGIRGGMDVSVAGGTVTARNIDGNVTIETSSGAVALSDIMGAVTVGSTTAAVTLSAVTGAIILHGGSGLTTIDFASGSIEAVQTSGDVVVRNLRGDVRVRTTQGSIRVDQKEGAFDLTSHSGDISVVTELYAEREFNAENITGSITVLIPEKAGAGVDITTLSGNIDTRGAPVEVETFTKRAVSGTIAGGGPKVTLRTESGNIRLGLR